MYVFASLIANDFVDPTQMIVKHFTPVLVQHGQQGVIISSIWQS